MTRQPQPPLIDPIAPGRLVTYREQDRGVWIRRGWNHDDEEGGTVRCCHWYEGRWSVETLWGTYVELSDILAVAELDSEGQVIASWTTQELWQEDECAR